MSMSLYSISIINESVADDDSPTSLLRIPAQNHAMSTFLPNREVNWGVCIASSQRWRAVAQYHQRIALARELTSRRRTHIHALQLSQHPGILQREKGTGSLNAFRHNVHVSWQNTLPVSAPRQNSDRRMPALIYLHAEARSSRRNV